MHLGDFNQDGFDDFAIGGKRTDIGAEDTGSLYIYLGPIPALEISNYHARIAGINPFDQISVSMTHSDIDNDGYTDIIVGGRMEQDGTVNQGRVYVFSGQGLLTP